MHNITPVSLWDRQRSLPSICYDPYTQFSILLLSLKSSYTHVEFGLISVAESPLGVLPCRRARRVTGVLEEYPRRLCYPFGDQA
jgi:hypothetical protein